MCDPDSYPIVHDSLYNKLAMAITRESKPDDLLSEEDQSQLRQLDIVGAHFRQNFFCIMANCISQRRLRTVVQLSLANCGL